MLNLINTFHDLTIFKIIKYWGKGLKISNIKVNKK